MTSPGPANLADQPGQSFLNTALGDAKVGGQFGTVNGTVNIYHVSPDDKPEKKFSVALNFLNGNMARRAEELINQAVEAGYTGTKVAYYWTLSVLSDRSFDHLDQKEFTSIRNAIDMANPYTGDEWSSAFAVVLGLFNCFLRQDNSGSLDQHEFNQVQFDLNRLPEERRDEIRRHLAMILEGGIQDQLDAEYAQEIHKLRMADNRTKRVWKFFEPIPAAPRAKKTDEPVFGKSQQARAVSGMLLTVAGVFLSFAVVLSKSVIAAVLMALFLIAGVLAIGRYGLTRSVGLGRLADKEAEYERPYRAGGGWTTRLPNPVRPQLGDGAEDSSKAALARGRQRAFSLLIPVYVQWHFDRQGPDKPEDQHKWERDTAGVKASLSERILDQYPGSDTEPGALNWLIKWHAEQEAARWKAGKYFDYRETMRVPVAAQVGFGTGAALMTGSAIIIAIGIFWAHNFYALISALLLGSGCWLLRNSEAWNYQVRRRRWPADLADFEGRMEREQEVYRKWEEVLKDRPTDDEMARWLDYDKMYLKTLAMNQNGLVNRDIITHIILTEASAPCLRARVLYGPARYSAYTVMIFLLAEAGVRQMSVTLDFATGTPTNQVRQAFSYDKISSARAAEVGISYNEGRRKVILPEKNEDHPRSSDGKSLILSQGLQLRFTNGDIIDVVAENFDAGFLDRMREDPNRLVELAVDISGLRGASRILEAVAAEGKEWIVQERARRRRRLMDFRNNLGPRQMLSWTRDSGSPEIIRDNIIELPSPPDGPEVESG